MIAECTMRRACRVSVVTTPDLWCFGFAGDTGVVAAPNAPAVTDATLHVGGVKTTKPAWPLGGKTEMRIGRRFASTPDRSTVASMRYIPGSSGTRWMRPLKR